MRGEEVAVTEESEPEARLVLPGAGSTRARVLVERQPVGRRAAGALLVLAVAIALMPVVFFVPPHFLWPLVSLGVGSFAAWRLWRGTYSVVSFEGRCPRCDTELDIPVGTRIRRRHTVDCYGCHRQPALVLEER
jgi:hypothetical protein